MTVSVGAVIVTQGDSASLDRTLAAVKAQTQPPQQIVVVEAENINQAIEKASGQLPGWVTDSEHFFWMLNNALTPEPSALAELLLVVERSPSLAVVSPKLMRAESPRVIRELGISLTPWGGLFSPAANQLDQAQHDTVSDILAVSTDAVLIRADAFSSLGGFDSRLVERAAQIDFAIRARLQGFRVEVAPASKVLVTGNEPTAAKQHRQAELQLKFAFASGWLLPFFWLALPLWGLVRAFYQVAYKRIDLVWGELSTAASAFLLPHRSIGLHRRVDRRALRQVFTLRSSWAEVNAQRRQVEPQATSQSEPAMARLVGLPWWLLLVAALSVGFWPADDAVVGGGLAPLSENWLRVFSHAGASWQESGFGAAIPAEPFKWVVAAFSALTFWQPSFSIALFLLFAKVLAFWGAARLFSRLTQNSAVAILAALAFAFAPPLTNALAEGNLSAAVSLTVAPWLVTALLAVVNLASSRLSWQTNVGSAGLLLAIELAASPSTAPIWILFCLVLMIGRIRNGLRLIWVLAPTIALFGPYLVFTVIGLEHPLLLLVDPASSVGHPLALWQAFFGVPAGVTLEPLALLNRAAWLVAPLFIMLLAISAAIASKRALTSWLFLIWMLATGYGWLISHTDVSSLVSAPNPTAVLGLGLLALIAGIVVAAPAKFKAVARVVAALVLLPLIGAGLLRVNELDYTDGRVLPAIVQAEWAQGHQLRVLRLEGDTEFTADLVTPDNLTLDGRSLGYQLSAANRADSPEAKSLANVAANLISGSSTNLTNDLKALRIGYVLTAQADSKAAAALDSSPQLEPVGATKFGRLWRVPGASGGLSQAQPSQTQLWSVTKGVQALVLLIFALMALPTGVRRVRARDTSLDEGEANDAA